MINTAPHSFPRRIFSELIIDDEFSEDLIIASGVREPSHPQTMINSITVATNDDQLDPSH